jgi:hypothetical protein
MGERLLSAGILLVVGLIVCGVGWLISMGFYAVGVWPVGAAIRVLVFGFGAFILFWMAKHLIQGQESIDRETIEKVLGRRIDEP